MLFNNNFYVPPYEPRKAKKRFSRKFRELPQAKPHLRMSFRTIRRRFNPWVYNRSPFVWLPVHKR